MALTDYASIDAYLQAQPQDVRDALAVVRSALRAALPSAEEAIRYQIPTLRQGGTNVIHFAGYPSHVGIYPASEAMLAALGDEIRPHLSGKATMRFPLSEPMPVDLIRRIGQLRAAELAARPKVKRR